MWRMPSSARGAPLCPAGHLPREGGDFQADAFSLFLAPLQANGKAAEQPISPLAGEMPAGRGGRLAPRLSLAS